MVNDVSSDLYRFNVAEECNKILYKCKKINKKKT